MNPEDFESSWAGRCVKIPAGYWAFIPHPLPPAISYDTSLIRLLSEADRLLGELSGTGRLLANPYLLIAPYVRREAEEVVEEQAQVFEDYKDYLIQVWDQKEKEKV